jgi:uncharacterized protein with HEPN domain
VKHPGLHLQHILASIEHIDVYVVGGREQFMGSPLLQDAVIRRLQTLAESTTHLPDAWKAAHPAVEWNAIRRFRNVVVHGYLDLRPERIWDIVEVDLPALRVAATELLAIADTPATE